MFFLRIFNVFVYIYFQLKKLLSKNFVVQRKYIYIQSKHIFIHSKINAFNEIFLFNDFR